MDGLQTLRVCVSYFIKQGKNIYFCRTLQSLVHFFRGMLPLRPFAIQTTNLANALIGCII